MPVVNSPSTSSETRAVSSAPDVEPAGFGNCGACPLMQHGSVAVCSACAGQSLANLPRERCFICDGSLDESGRCRNQLCRWEIAERGFSMVFAVSSNTGPLRTAIHRYKYRDKWGWKLIFGRVLAGYLAENHEVFEDYDVMLPSPTYVGGGGRGRDHVTEMVRELEREAAHRWPIRYDVISKTRATDKMADTTSSQQRLLIAREQLIPALSVDRPDVIKGRRVLVFDDVFTGGHTLMAVATALRSAGALEVSQVVLARQTWTT